MKKSIKYIDLACDTETKKKNMFTKFLNFFGKSFEEFEKISWNGDDYYKLYFHDRHNKKDFDWVFVSDFEVYGSRDITYIDQIKTNKLFGGFVKSKLDAKNKKEYSSAWQIKHEEILNEYKLDIINF